MVLVRLPGIERNYANSPDRAATSLCDPLTSKAWVGPASYSWSHRVGFPLCWITLEACQAFPYSAESDHQHTQLWFGCYTIISPAAGGAGAHMRTCAHPDEALHSPVGTYHFHTAGVKTHLSTGFRDCDEFKSQQTGPGVRASVSVHKRQWARGQTHTHISFQLLIKKISLEDYYLSHHIFAVILNGSSDAFSFPHSVLKTRFFPHCN